MAALAGTTFLPGVTSPASAHDSGYCGHGRDGYIDLTMFIRHFDGVQQGVGYVHYHTYAHVMTLGAEDHSVTKICNHD